MQQKIPHREVSHLEIHTNNTRIKYIHLSHWIFCGLAVDKRNGHPHAYLFFNCSLLIDELVENSAVLLVKLLHLVDVTRNFVHGLHCNWKEQIYVIIITSISCILIIYTNRWYIIKKKGTLAYHPDGNVPHCQDQWESRAPSAAAGTSGPFGWVWSGKTPAWMNVAVWGFSQPGKPWNLGRSLLEEQKYEHAFVSHGGQ